MTERERVLRQIRGALSDLAAEGIEVIPRPAREHPESEGARSGVTETPDPEGGDRAAALQAVREELGDCRRCRLSEGRSNIVFGEGSPEARVVFVGEGPGAEEDRTGRPFVGKAGKLLDKMIEAVEWRREDVYICNLVKCRPPGNRNPELDEVASCRSFLESQLRSIRPAVIVTLGKPAASTLLNRNVAITRERGIWNEWEGIPVMPTFHPAYLLRQYTQKNRQAVWDDLRAVRERAEQG